MLCPMVRPAAPFLLCVVPLASACAAPPPETDFSAHDSASRVHSIRATVTRNDESRVRHIVEQLDAADPVIRMTAIHALEELTGETNGYHYDDPRWRREPAVERWVAYVNRTYPASAPADG